MKERLLDWILFALVFMTFQRTGRQASEDAAPPPPQVLPAIEKLQALQELVLLRVVVADILTYAEGSVEAAWIVRGDGLLAVPLAEARVLTRDDDHRTVQIELPRPRVLSSRLDQEHTVLWDVEESLWNRLNPWRPDRSALERRGLLEAQRLIHRAVDSPDQRAQCQARAEVLVESFFRTWGWDAAVRWSGPPPDPDSLPPKECSPHVPPAPDCRGLPDRLSSP